MLSLGCVLLTDASFHYIPSIALLYLLSPMQRNMVLFEQLFLFFHFIIKLETWESFLSWRLLSIFRFRRVAISFCLPLWRHGSSRNCLEREWHVFLSTLKHSYWGLKFLPTAIFKSSLVSHTQPRVFPANILVPFGVAWLRSVWGSLAKICMRFFGSLRVGFCSMENIEWLIFRYFYKLNGQPEEMADMWALL